MLFFLEYFSNSKRYIFYKQNQRIGKSKKENNNFSIVYFHIGNDMIFKYKKLQDNYDNADSSIFTLDVCSKHNSTILGQYLDFETNRNIFYKNKGK